MRHNFKRLHMINRLFLIFRKQSLRQPLPYSHDQPSFSNISETISAAALTISGHIFPNRPFALANSFPSSFPKSQPSKLRQIYEPLRFLNSSRNWTAFSLPFVRLSRSFSSNCPYFNPSTMSAPVHAPQTSPLFIPPPKHAPICKACFSVMPNCSANAANTACEHLNLRSKSSTAFEILSIAEFSDCC